MSSGLRIRIYLQDVKMINLNRRSFLTRITGIAVATLTVGKFTYDLHGIRSKSAITYLTKAFNTVSKGKVWSNGPKLILVSQELFDKYESELTPMYRFASISTGVTEPNLAFKCTKMKPVKQLKNWDYIFV